MKKQYIPKEIRDKKAFEFHDLVQGNMVVAQYESKFSELTPYVQHMVTNEEEKAKKFQSGLAPYIMRRLVRFKLRMGPYLRISFC